MASGNLGDLFVSLGIKDEMSETLRKIVKGMKGVDQATQDAKKQGEDLIKSLNGLNGNNFSKVFRDATKYIEDNSKGISNIISLLKKVEEKTDSNAITSKFFGVKELPRIAEYLTAINAEFAKMAKDEARADNIKAWQSRITNSLEYIKILQDIDLWQRKIDSTKANNPNVNSKSLDDAKKSLSEIRRQIVGLLSSGGVDTSGVLSNFSKFLSIARKEVNDVISTFKKENPLSSFSGGAAKVEADIARVGEKLAKLRDLMSEGSVRGYNTSMLGGNITELNNLLARLQSAQGNKNILTDEAQMKNLLSDVAVGMVKATAATQAYGREKGKVIAQEKLAAAEYDRRNAAEKQRQRAREAELKAMDAYAKRYMELVAARDKAMASMKEAPGLKNDKGLRNISNEIDTLLNKLVKVREDITLYNHAIGTGTKEGIAFGQQGLKEANAEAERLISTIENLQNVYNTLRNSQAHVNDLVGNSFGQIRNRDVLAKMSDFYRAEEKASAKKAAQDEAQAKRDAAKATREQNAAEKQRQRAREAELKAMDAYAKRYMELVAARDKAMASMKEAPGLKNDKGLRNISNEIDTLLNKLVKVREDITLYNHAIGTGTKEGIAFGQQGLKEANAEAERLISTIENLQNVYNTLRNSQAHVNDLVGNSFGQIRNRDVLAKMSDFYRAEEKASAKKAAQDEAQAKRDAAKATREQNAAEKQRQRAREAELKAMDAYAKRYMELVAARDKAMASMKEAPGLKNDKGLRNISNEIDTLLNKLVKVREDITLYNHAIGTGTKEGIAFGQQGLKEANAEAERLMSTIENLQNVYNTLRNSQAHINDLVGNSFGQIRNRDVLAKMSDFYRAEEKASAKKAAQDEAQAKRDAAKATREQNAAEKQRQRAREAELKAMDAYAKRYMELVAARDKAMASMKEAPGLKNDKGLRNISNEIDTLLNKLVKVREDITLYNHAIGTGTKEGIAFGQQGLKEANAEAERLISTIENLQNVYNTLRNSQAHINDLVGNSFGQIRNRDVLAKMSDFYRAEEKASAKKAAQDEAQAKRDAAKATREQNAAEKQRQRELEISARRVQSLEKAINNLKEKSFTSKMLGLDTSEAFAKVINLENQLNQLRSLMLSLSSGDMTAVGKIGNIGNGREVQAANDLARSYDRANKEAEKGIEIERRRQQEIAKTAAKVQSDLVRGFEKANSHAGKLNSTIQDLKSLFLQGGLVFGIQQFFNSIVKTGGEIQQQRVALQSILGDVGKANELFNQTQQLALQSPFKFGELNRDVKQLAAFGVEANDLYDTTKRLADIASGLGVSFERLGLAYGQVKARSWLDGKELRQFAYAGLPLLQRITELYNATGKNGRNDYTQADVKKMISNREVSFEDVQKVLWNMTDEGGQFYNMQFVLSETLLGKWNKLIDAWEIMLGKFADGKNVIGGTFKYAISGATDLILALDKLSPLLLSFGATFVARKGIGALYGNIAAKAGIGGILSSQKEAVNIRLREYAIQQQQLVAEKQITQEKATQKVAAMGYALTSKEEQINAMQRLALEGRLSMMQMQEAYRKGLITQELLSQLEVMGLISAKQKEIVANATIENRVRAIGMTAMSSVGKLFTWGNAAFLGISVAIGAIIHYFQKTEEIEQRSKDIATSAQQRINSLNDALSSANGINKDSEAPDIERVNEQLQSVLEQSGLFTDTIKEQIEQASTLTEKYQILKGAVSDAKNASSVQGKFADTISKAIDASGGFLNDDITENVKDVMDSYNKMQTLLAGLDEATKERMSSIANQFLKPEQASLSLEEKIDLLADMSEEDFDKFVRAASNGSNDIAHSLYLIRDRANITKDHFNEIAKDDVPKILEVIRIALGKNEKEFMHWAQHNIKSFDSMFMKIIELCNANVPTIVTKLRKIFYESVGMEPPKEPSKGGNKPKPYNSGLKAGGAGENARKKLQKSGKLNKTNYKAYDAELQIYDSDSSEEFGENLRKRYKEIRNENNARKKAGRKVSAESIARQKRIEEIAAVSGVSLDVGKDKVTGDFGKDGKNGRQEDTLLKNLQERLSSLKSARQMYQKFNTILPDEEARKRTYEQFPEVVGLDLKDYQVAVRKLLEKFNANTPERRKFRTSVYREVAEWLFSEKDKKEYDKKAADFSEYMNRLSNQWDLYKSLLEKTGNKNYAGAAWIDAFQMDEKTKSLMDAYYHQYGKLFNMQEAISLTDGEAKEKLKGYGEYEAWKKIVDLLRNNYVQSLQDGADAMQQTMSVAQKLDSITEKYAKKRKDAGADQGLIDRYDFLEKQEKSSVLFDQMKSEVNWDGVFGNLNNYTKKELKKVRKDINSLISGGLLNGMSTTDIKSIYDGLGKLNQTVDGEGFSGLSDLLKDLIDASEKYDEAVKEYNKSVKENGSDDWKTEQARKSMLQAEQRRRNAQGNVDTKKGTIVGNAVTLANMFKTLGAGNGSGSTLLQNAGGWTESIMNMMGGNKNSQKIGSIVGMFAGLTEVISEKGFGGFLSDAFEDIGGAVNSIFKDVLGINLGISGADYSDYNDAKEEYDNLISVWDSLISKKTEYMNIHWGTEATEASKEAQAMLEAEIEQTKIIAQNRLSAGASAGSHSIGYRMWKGSYKYNGQNWRDVASDISSKYGVRFNGMEDLLNMNSDTLSKIKQDYTGLWATMDGDYRDYLEKLIEYGDKADDMVENLTEKLTGNKFSSLVESWGDAMASMANSSDNLVDNFENNLKKTIINSMIEDMYGDKIKAILAKAKKYGDKDESENWYVGGEYMGAWTPAENAEVKSDIEDVAKQIEATRDFFKKSYGWSDNSSSSSTNSVKGITEETANLLASYANAIRLDCSVIRAEQAKFFPEMSEIAKSQLTQLNQISQHTLRNAEAAERIETVVTSLNDNFNRVINGAKVLHVK